MPLFAVLDQRVTPRVRAAVGRDEALAEALFDFVAQHRQGNPGTAGQEMGRHNEQIMSEWARHGRDSTFSAVWSRFTLPNDLVILIKTNADLTLICTETEYHQDIAYLPASGE